MTAKKRLNILSFLHKILKGNEEKKYYHIYLREWCKSQDNNSLCDHEDLIANSYL